MSDRKKGTRQLERAKRKVRLQKWADTMLMVWDEKQGRTKDYHSGPCPVCGEEDKAEIQNIDRLEMYFFGEMALHVECKACGTLYELCYELADVHNVKVIDDGVVVQACEERYYGQRANLTKCKEYNEHMKKVIDDAINKVLGDVFEGKKPRMKLIQGGKDREKGTREDG